MVIESASFEEVSSNPHAAILRIADFMDIHLSPEQLPVEEATQKQSGALNQFWLERYMDNNKGGVLFTPVRHGIAAGLKRRLANILKSG